MKSNDEIIFCPLGGSGEIGANMNLYGFDESERHKWIIVDCGNYICSRKLTWH